MKKPARLKQKRECREGPEATKGSERTITALFRVPKTQVVRKIRQKLKKGKRGRGRTFRCSELNRKAFVRVGSTKNFRYSVKKITNENDV